MKMKEFEPARIFEEYERGKNYKASLGNRGLYEQAKINERFYVGDQWHGAQCGNDKPLMQHNLIKRIAEYKMAMVAGAGAAVNYTAEGVPSTEGIRERARAHMDALRDNPSAMDGQSALTAAEETNVVTQALSAYFKTTAERVKLDDLKNEALRKAYIAGTGVLYTYWDERVKTGLYADAAQKSPIMGDIRCEVLDVENVYFGDPNLDSVQEQPYIILSQRKSVEELKRTARRNHRPAEEIDAIKPDRDTEYLAGERATDEPEESRKATVLTKLWKEWDDEGREYKIMATEVVKGATLRKPWDMKIRLYPIAKINWENRLNCVYGDTEATYLVPNQIAINRCLTAETQALVAHGMPIMLVDGDIVSGPVTNDPGQIIRVYGAGNGVSGAIGYAQVPSFAPQFTNAINNLMQNTLTQSGANEAALGDARPDNASAIMAMREAATRPLQLLQNRFYSFVEDVARIWAEFWLALYGNRSLKIEDKNGVWYLPFDSDKWRNLPLTTRVDVGAAGLWSELQTQQTLDNMLTAKLIDPLQYLERLPKGSVPNLGGLIRDYQNRAAQQMPPDEETPDGGQPVSDGMMPDGAAPAAPTQPDMEAIMRQLPPEYQHAFASMSPEQQSQVIASITGQ